MSFQPIPELRDRVPALQAYLLGLVDYDVCLALQQRLVYEVSGRNDGQALLLLCEHDGPITIGRHGSWGHVRASRRELESQRRSVRWVNRGGGAVVHLPGQLAIYPIVPLAWHRMSVGDYANRLQTAIAETIAELGVPAETRPGRHGVWGRAGHLATLGIAVKSWTSYHGAFLNVAPPLHLLRLAESDPCDGTRASSLAAERRQPIKMPRVREAVVRRLAAALGFERYHLYSGHPLLPLYYGSSREAAARVG